MARKRNKKRSKAKQVDTAPAASEPVDDVNELSDPDDTNEARDDASDRRDDADEARDDADEFEEDEPFFQGDAIPASALKYLVEAPDENPSDSDWDDDDLFDENGEPIDLSKLKPRPSPMRLLLMVAVIGFAGWLIHAYWPELQYYFQPDEPHDLGNAMDYIMVTGEDGVVSRARTLDLPGNTYVRVRGLPTHQAVADTERSSARFGGGNIFGSDPKIVYQLEGARLFVEEDVADSAVADFNEAAAKGDPDAQTVIELLDLEGRLLSFAEDDDGTYAGIRQYYADKYGMRFCSDMPEAEIEQMRSELGQGGSVLTSADGGESYIESVTGTTSSLYALDVTTAEETGFAVGSGGHFMSTNDGGSTWQPGAVLGAGDRPGHTPSLYDVGFDATRKNGVVVGQRGALYQSADGGTSFDAPYPYIDRDLRAVEYMPDGSILAAGAEGAILRSTDGGLNWSPRPIVSQPEFHDVVRTPTGAMVAVGDDGLVLRRATPDANWVPRVSDTSASLRSIALLPDASLVATGTEHTVLFSVDDGLSWAHGEVRVVLGLDDDLDFESVALHGDGQRAVFVGDDGAFGSSVDAGRQVELRSGAHATGTVVDQLLAGTALPAAIARVAASAHLPRLRGVAWAGDVAYAVGADATLLRSSDFGLTWTPQGVPLENEKLDLWDIAFVSPIRGFIVGQSGLVLSTSNGGQTWTRMAIDTTLTLRSLTIHPDDPNVVLFAGRGGIWGYWKAEKDRWFYPKPQAEVDFNGVAPATLGPVEDTRAMRLVLVGEDASVVAFDDEADVAESQWTAGAATLNALSVAAEAIPTGPTPHADKHIAIAVGDGGRVFRSINGGLGFHPEHSGTHQHLYAAALSRDGLVAAVGGADGTLLVDVGADQRWTRGDLGSRETVRAIGIDRDISTQLIVAAGNGIYRSSDAGQVFVPALVGDRPFRAIVQDPLTGRWWAAGDAGLLARSDDGGTTWATAGGVPDRDLRALWVRGDAIRAVGSDNVVIRSDDGGASFELGTAGSAAALTGVGFTTDGSRGWATGAGGLLVETEDGGATWTPRPAMTDAPLRGLFAHPDGERMWIVGGDQTIFARDRGEEWAPRSPLPYDLYGLSTSRDGQLVFAVGDGGTILKSTNGGLTWNIRPTSTANRLHDVAIASDGRWALAVGDSGTLLRTRSAGEGWVRRSAPFANDIFAVALVDDPNPDDEADETVVLITGEDGVTARAPSRELDFELAALPLAEDLRDIALLGGDEGTVMAIGGSYEDPATVCEDGYILVAGVAPSDHLRFLIMALLIGSFALFTAVNLVRQVARYARK